MVVVVVVVRIPLLKREVVTLLYYFRPVCSTFRYSGWLSRAVKGQGLFLLSAPISYQLSGTRARAGTGVYFVHE